MRSLIIAEEERKKHLDDDSIKIEQELTYQIDSFSFNVVEDRPVEGEEVIIEDDNLAEPRIFAGIIVKSELEKDSPQHNLQSWAVDCDDYTALLDRKRVNERYKGWTGDAIFIDIAEKYCPGFTTNGVRTGAPTIEDTGEAFYYKPPSECFKWLCDYTGWHWQPDYYKDLQFFSLDELINPAPMDLEPGSQFDELKHSINTQDLRNRVYVIGGTMLSDPQTIQWKADGAARQWVIPWSPNEIQYDEELGYIGIGETPYSIGQENADDEETKDYLYNFEEKYIRCAPGTTTPAAGATMSYMARQDIDVITIVEDLESQAVIAAVQGGDGVYEHVITDESLITIEAAEAAGNADLRDNANPTVKGSFKTQIPGWKPGQLVNINLPDRGISGTFLVQKVTVTSATPNIWTWKVDYGGRLKGIEDTLKALVSAQQNKKTGDTAILHKFVYGQERAGVKDELILTPRELPYVCGDSDAICGLVVCSNG